MIDSLVKIYDEFSKGSRVQDLAQLARENQFRFYKRQSFGQQKTEIKAFQIFSLKGTKRFLGLLVQDADGFNGSLRCYDYLNTKDLETKTQSIIEVYCEDIFVDYIKIEPKSTFSKVKGFFSSSNKQFAHLQKFNQQFQISFEEQDATLVLAEAALKLLNDCPGITVECLGNYFLFYFRKKEMPLQDIMTNIDLAEDFVKLLCFDRSEDYV